MFLRLRDERCPPRGHQPASDLGKGSYVGLHHLLAVPSSRDTYYGKPRIHSITMNRICLRKNDFDGEALVMEIGHMDERGRFVSARGRDAGGVPLSGPRWQGAALLLTVFPIQDIFSLDCPP